MMQEGALTSFALYDLYHTLVAYKHLTSEIMSRIEYLIPSVNIAVM